MASGGAPQTPHNTPQGAPRPVPFTHSARTCRAPPPCRHWGHRKARLTTARSHAGREAQAKSRGLGTRKAEGAILHPRPKA